ncbi:RagB/SusD family nutrient uptake outer membrane protein [Chryseobacterium lactis]|uniref:RagB/SusD family nutrient uptake outer membrane protein n=1 Tax=Chryseobacterium lactis TaxID=1241981 RepID=A0A3G6RPC7_CHRLC|nr:RagB/SusD family nutrient uptake outer membrane protein [Chryseobacterium lactis]AZA81744.1 RagB/SusD family nutrient uptake outer membrane protein [Chryseobacterium lactis]AZB06742.1 RagB/SusD family nutrient uptake outer membrane protein [Chryseobacterium lactis]PNW15593.1 RagB/SusD family nutrient uptake outer membrane protein [Chryseobacterium lactis]
MKRNIIKLLFVAGSLTALPLLNSCSDAIEAVQPGQLDDSQAFATMDGLQAFLIGSVYGNLETGNEVYLTSVITDEVKPGDGSGGQEFSLHRFIVSGGVDTLPELIWVSHYRTINRVNRLLAGASKVTPNGATETANYNKIIAQAKAIRAFCYLELETYYSPNMGDENALGVILSDKLDESNFVQKPRVSNKEIYALIDSDLQSARTLFTQYDAATTTPANLKSDVNKYYVGKSFVNAISARFNLYRGNYAQAKIDAQAVISATAGVSGAAFALTLGTPSQPNVTPAPAIGSAAWNSAFYLTSNSFNPYRNLWDDKDANRGETIFALGRQATGTNGIAIGSRYNLNSSSVTGTPWWYVGRNLYNMLRALPDDVRKYAFVDPSSTPNPNYMNPGVNTRADKLIVDKYPGKTGTNTRNDIKSVRLSEMYFILSEVAAQSGDFIGAANNIKMIRDARSFSGTPTVAPVYANATAAYKDILAERRIELCFEGHRYIDLKRLAVKAGVSMDRNSTDDIVDVSNLTNGDYRYTLPIPSSEVAGNPGVQQNTGY